MADYKLFDNGIMRTSDGLMFPPEPDNTYYQTYLDWVAAGGVADPYVPPPMPTPPTPVNTPPTNAELMAQLQAIAAALGVTVS
jgi:hypothetical protein